MNRRDFLIRLTAALALVPFVSRFTPTLKAAPAFPPDNWIDLPAPVSGILSSSAAPAAYIFTSNGVYRLDATVGPYRIDTEHEGRIWFMHAPYGWDVVQITHNTVHHPQTICPSDWFDDGRPCTYQTRPYTLTQ